jgi:hypothetical protein
MAKEFYTPKNNVSPEGTYQRSDNIREYVLTRGEAMRFLCLFGISIILSCTPSIVKPVKLIYTEDIDSWKGLDFIELETHPEFSTMQLQIKELSNGDKLYDYVNTVRVKRPVYTDCSSFSYKSLSKTDCETSGGDYHITCHHQFFIRTNGQTKNKYIVQYRPVGRCKTDCARRPSSRPCTQKELSEREENEN